MLQAPARGYSTITTLRKELDCDSTLSARLLTLPYTVRTTGMRFSSSSPQTISLRPIRFVTRSPVRSTTTSASTAPAPGKENPTSFSGRYAGGTSSSARSMKCSRVTTTQSVASIGSHTSTPATR